MRAYIIRRLLLIIPTLFLVSILVFFVTRLIPGDIVDQMAQQRVYMTESTRWAIEHQLGLDVPIPVQYGRWVGVVPQADGSFRGLFQGDLGNSLWTQTPVTEEILSRLPVTVELGILAMLILLIISLPIGVYSAIRQDSVGDYAGRSLATVLIALPNFWVGIMVVIFGSLWFGMSPPLRPIPFFEDPIGNLGQFIVPAIVLGMAGAGTTVRMTRSMMLEVLRQDYVRTAWAKGLKEGVVITRHVLKNALIPVVTLLGSMLRFTIGGAVIIEKIFGLPGMGRLLVDATTARDYTLITGMVLIFACFVILVNLAIDLTYNYLDPRVRYK